MEQHLASGCKELTTEQEAAKQRQAARSNPLIPSDKEQLLDNLRAQIHGSLSAVVTY
jgi:hypothetical protein